MWYPKYKLMYRLALFTGAAAVAGVLSYLCLHVFTDPTCNVEGHFLVSWLMELVLWIK